MPFHGMFKVFLDLGLPEPKNGRMNPGGGELTSPLKIGGLWVRSDLVLGRDDLFQMAEGC